MKTTSTKIERTTKVKTLLELSDMEVLANAFNNEKECLVEKFKYEEAAKLREQQMDVLIGLKKDLTIKLADIVRIIGDYKKPRNIKFVKHNGVEDYINHAKMLVQRAGWKLVVPVEPKKTKKSIIKLSPVTVKTKKVPKSKN